MDERSGGEELGARGAVPWTWRTTGQVGGRLEEDASRGLRCVHRVHGAMRSGFGPALRGRLVEDTEPARNQQHEEKDCHVSERVSDIFFLMPRFPHRMICVETKMKRILPDSKRNRYCALGTIELLKHINRIRVGFEHQ